jgi:hypothetical protein
MAWKNAIFAHLILKFRHKKGKGMAGQVGRRGEDV